MTIDFAAARHTMVENQLRTYDVLDAAVLAAILAVPREDYVPAERRSIAYLDQPVRLSANRALLVPMVFGRLLQALAIRPGDKVLDVAGGSGYSAAVLAELSEHVRMLEEPDAPVAPALPARIARSTGAVAQGAADHGPYDVILVNGAVEQEPDALLAQLAEGGRLGVVLGAGRSGRAMVYRKSGSHVSGQAIFDAAASILPEFARAPRFAF